MTARRALAAAAALFAILTAQATADPAPVKLALFAFELDDRSAGGGIIAQDAIDTENLTRATQEAGRMLSASGRYAIVDTSSVASEVTVAGGVLNCNGCDATLAKKLGAEQSMIGVFTRVNRTEFTLQILVRDANTSAVISNDFTGLRMGANYAWPRGVVWLMDKKILATSAGSAGAEPRR